VAGAGPSIVLIDPMSAPEHGDGSNWRASHAAGGNAGSTDALVFAGDPAADLDQDGIPALLEFALGGSDADPSDRQRLPVMGSISADGIDYPALVFSRPRDIDGLRFTLQISDDLTEWTDHAAFNEAPLPQPPGTVIPVHFRSPVATAATPQQFLRLKVEPTGP
jgi:hypothetical protein